MTLHEARGISALTGSARDTFSHQGAVKHFQAGGPAERARLLEAMALLAEQGEPWEQEMAGQFFAGVPLPADVRARLVRLYAARDFDSRHPLSVALAQLGRELAPDEVAILRRAYLADPERRARIAEALLERDPDGAVWGAYAARVARLGDVEELARAYEAVLLARDREPDFFALIARKGEPVVRALAERLGGSSPSARRLLAAAGLTP